MNKLKKLFLEFFKSDEKLCPNCWFKMRTNKVKIGSINIEIYECDRCGFTN